MTTSGVVQTHKTISELIIEAFDYCQIGVEEESLDAEDSQRALRAANFLLRTWQAQGIHLWQYTECTLFPQAGRTEYYMTPQDDTVTDNSTEAQRAVRCIRSDVVLYAQVSIAAPPPPNDTSFFILVATQYDCDGNAWANQDGPSMIGARIGVFDTDNFIIDWAQITEFELWTAGTPTQTIALPNDGRQWSYWRVKTDLGFSTIADGDAVYIYQDGYQVNPERLLDIRRVVNPGTDNETETPLKLDSHEEFQRLPNKRVLGVPNVATFDRLVNGACFKLWQSMRTDIEYFLRLTVERTFEGFVNTNDTADFPQYWQDAFVFNLAERLCIKFRVPPGVQADIRQKASETLNQALSYDNANYDMSVVINNRVGG